MHPKDARKLLRLYFLGSFQIEGDNGSINLPPRKVQSLLAYLILHPGEHTRERLASLFWGDSTDAQARDSLRTALKTLRKQLRDDLLLADRETVEINPDFPIWVDAQAFAKLLNLEPQAAIDLYRGDLLSDLYDEWISPERERYRELYLNALLQLAASHRAAGDYVRAIDLSQKVLATDPANERAHRQLMFCYHARGDRAAALKQYGMCVSALLADLGVAPSSETTTLYEEIKRSGTDVLPSEPRRTSLPIPLTVFVGREKEIREIKEILSESRLLTLTGPGGTGKTRLATEVATKLSAAFPDGVGWVEFGVLNDPALVPQHVAKALGLREVPNQPLTETLAHDLHLARLLLVFDNCEHLVDACARLTDTFLQACPSLTILTTSREALGIPGERVYRVPALTFPQTLEMPMHQVLEHEATRLFVERAIAANSDFGLNNQNAFFITQICQRLDGIPLAIELAAARVRVLSPEEIAARLNDRFKLLTSGSRTAAPRHQTLRATIDWSYNLLTEEERTLFRRLSVFAGGFTLDAARMVYAGDSSKPAGVLDLLSHLVDKSLVIVAEQGRASRYRLLDSIRDYAREKLGDAKETDTIYERHLEFFVTLAEEAEPQLFGAEQAAWFDRLETDRDNLRAAVEWSLGGDRAESALRLIAALWYFWFSHGPLSEAYARLKQGLDQPAAAPRSAIRAKALNVYGFFNWGNMNQFDPRPQLEEALAIGMELGDMGNVATSLRHLGLLAHLEGDFAQARSLLEQSLAIGQGLGSWQRIRNSQTLLFLGDVVLNQGDTARAKALFEESIVELGPVKDKNFLAYSIRRLGQLASDRGELEQATEMCKESLRLNVEVRDRRGSIACLAAIAGILSIQGRFGEAAELSGSVHALLDTYGVRLLPIDEIRFSRNLAAARAELDGGLFNAAWARGLGFSHDKAIEVALNTTGRPENFQEQQFRREKSGSNA